jgi:hypothetical protein
MATLENIAHTTQSASNVETITSLLPAENLQTSQQNVPFVKGRTPLTTEVAPSINNYPKDVPTSQVRSLTFSSHSIPRLHTNPTINNQLMNTYQINLRMQM